MKDFHLEKDTLNVISIAETTSTPKSGQTSLILKLRSILEEEKKKNKLLNEQLDRLMKRNRQTEDSIR